LKKLALVFIVFLLILGSCSTNNSQPDESILILPKKIVETGSYSNTTTFIYVGNKIATATNSDGSKAAYTYTENFITKIESYDSNNALISTVDFSYTNGKVSLRVVKGLDPKLLYKTDYIYNTDGTVTEKSTTLNTISNVITQDGTVKYTYVNGNLVKKEETSGANPSTTTYEYDTKNHPAKNIEGMILIGMGTVNNETESTSVNNINTSPTVNMTAYTYDANGFPVGSKSDYGTTQYFY
jgi:hypothetical protein